jgi:hypothetical protein
LVFYIKVVKVENRSRVIVLYNLICLLNLPNQLVLIHCSFNSWYSKVQILYNHVIISVSISSKDILKCIFFRNTLFWGSIRKINVTEKMRCIFDLISLLLELLKSLQTLGTFIYEYLGMCGGEYNAEVNFPIIYEYCSQILFYFFH